MTGSTTVLAQSGERESAAGDLLAWYDQGARRLPWRAPPGERADPYHVWLSEVMLQQTTVATVIPYFHRFLERWPRIEDLAAADLDAVMAAWAGLGYYARARNLHKCARAVTESGGRFPETEAELKALPGIGEYMAAAIAAIAFDKPATVVDGNVERVIARLFAIDTPLPKAKAEIRRAAESLTPGDRSGDYAQALMDLGATICRPKAPNCLLCPWQSRCAAHARGLAETLPKKEKKKPKPTRHAVAFWLESPDPETGERRVLLRRRAEDGLLGGMLELPSTPWQEGGPWSDEDAMVHVPIHTEWEEAPGEARHTFTHFHLRARIWTGESDDAAPVEGAFYRLDDLDTAAISTAVRKMMRLVD